MWKLFLDDERNVEQFYEDVESFTVARSYDEAFSLFIEKGLPSFISFDNDLGEGQKEGYDLAKAIVECVLDGTPLPSDFSFHVHSANCKAWENISVLLNNFMKFRKDENAG